MGQRIKSGLKSDLTDMCVWVLKEFLCTLNSKACHIFFELFAEIERADIQFLGNGIQRNGLGVVFV